MKVVGCQPYAPAVFTPQEIFLVLISVRGSVGPRAIVQPTGLCQWKNPLTPWGIEPATCQFVALCLNQLCHRGPLSEVRANNINYVYPLKARGFILFALYQPGIQQLVQFMNSNAEAWIISFSTKNMPYMTLCASFYKNLEWLNCILDLYIL
jgi:hypothetical protein